MSAAPPTSTLFATETQLRPLVLLTTAALPLLTAVIFGCALGTAPRALWAVCALTAAAALLSNLHYLRTHTQTTIGMIPVSCASLLPATLAGVCARGLPLGLRAACMVLCPLLFAILALFVVWFVRLRRTYETHPHVEPTAALIVLGGAIKRGQPCETLARRLDVAARLWHEAPTRTLVVSGGPTPDHTTTEAREMARYLQAHGVDARSILLEQRARNTKENIAYALPLLDAAHHTGQRCVVSSDYHLWRAVRDARALGADLTPIAAPTPRASVPQQWCREVLTVLFGG